MGHRKYSDALIEQVRKLAEEGFTSFQIEDMTGMGRKSVTTYCKGVLVRHPKKYKYDRRIAENAVKMAKMGYSNLEISIELRIPEHQAKHMTKGVIDADERRRLGIKRRRESNDIGPLISRGVFANGHLWLPIEGWEESRA